MSCGYAGMWQSISCSHLWGILQNVVFEWLNFDGELDVGFYGQYGPMTCLYSVLCMVEDSYRCSLLY